MSLEDHLADPDKTWGSMASNMASSAVGTTAYTAFAPYTGLRKMLTTGGAKGYAVGPHAGASGLFGTLVGGLGYLALAGAALASAPAAVTVMNAAAGINFLYEGVRFFGRGLRNDYLDFLQERGALPAPSNG